MGQWIQQNDANWRIPYVGGWCEGFVEGAWGQATLPTPQNQTTNGVWSSAIAKWNGNPGNGNHPGELPPVGKTVPVYFSLGSTSYGHTAISLDDGEVASSTQAGYHTQGFIHPTLNNLISVYGQYNNGCNYLGWSEYVGNTKALVWEDNHNIDDVTSIPFTSSNVDDPELPLGQTAIATVGVNGTRTATYNIVTHDNVEVSRSTVSNVTVPPVNEVVNVGSYVKPVPVPPTPPVNPVIPVPPVKQPTISPTLLSLIIKLLKWLFKIK